jgi:acetoin utilization protein AcuB
MFTTREISQSHWSHFLRDIEKLTRDRPVRVELVGPLGHQVLAEMIPLRSITWSAKPSDKGLIELDLGRDAELDHRIIRPVRLAIEENASGGLECLNIEDEERTKTLIIFEHPLELTEGRWAVPARPARQVREFMTATPQTIPPGTTVAQALSLMRQLDVRHLPVLEERRPVGIVSDRDLLLVESLRGVDPSRVSVDQAMTRDPYQVGPETRIDEVAAVMAKRKYGSALVVEAGKVIGILTTVDALRAFIELYAESRGPFLS